VVVLICCGCDIQPATERIIRFQKDPFFDDFDDRLLLSWIAGYETICLSFCWGF